MAPTTRSAAGTANQTAASSRPRRGAAAQPAAGPSGVAKKSSAKPKSKKTNKKTASKKPSRRPRSVSPEAEAVEAAAVLDGAEGEANPAADAENGDADAEVPWDRHRRVINILAEVEQEITCTFQGERATLTAVLQVHPDPAEYSSRLGYWTRLYLTRTVNAVLQKDDIGYIGSWRINKPTAAFRAAKTSWLQEIVQPNGNNAPAEIRETCFCLQALYTKGGQPKAALHKHKAELADNSLMFTEMIYIRPDFQQKGLLEPVLRSYHRILGKLPEWFAFKGTIVLVPGAPVGERGAAWGEMQEDVIEKILIKAYRRRGGYRVWVRNAAVSGNLITVMGRTVGITKFLNPLRQ